MPPLLLDECLDGRLVDALLRRLPYLDILTAYDAELDGADDPAILEWAASEGRILVTVDRKTMPGFVADRLRRGLGTPGVFLIRTGLSIPRVAEELEIILACCEPAEWVDRVTYIPL